MKKRLSYSYLPLSEELYVKEASVKWEPYFIGEPEWIYLQFGKETELLSKAHGKSCMLTGGF